MEQKFKIIGLGGIDESGKNCYILETKEDIIILDAGSANFTDKTLGIDFILPDYNYLIENKDKVRGILISHGHIDQIGGLNKLLSLINVNVYASGYTIKFLKTYIDKTNWKYLKEFKYNKKLKLGNLLIENFSLSHAIFGNYGYLIANNDNDAIVYATDYNFNQSANLFARTDIKKIVQLNNKYNIVGLLTESISADKIGIAASDKKYIKEFERIIEEATSRIIIGLYSSNLAGMTTIIEAAEKYNKKIVIIGRDLLKYVNIAREEGYLNIKKDIFLKVSDINKIKKEDLIVVVSGLYSSVYIDLLKMSTNQNEILQIEANDTIVIAAKPYDEIESFAQNVLDKIARTNCKIKTLNLNVPSHAFQEDIKMMINLFDPQYVIPIKGEFRKLKQVKDLMVDISRNVNDCLLINSGDILSIYDQFALVEDEINLEENFSTSNNLLVDEKLMNERESLANNGYVAVQMVYLKKQKKFSEKPIIISGGLSDFSKDEQVISKLEKIVNNEIAKNYDRKTLFNKIKNKITRNLQNLIGKTPLVLVTIIEINEERIN